MKTDEEYTRELEDMMCGDPEADHINADNLLIEVLQELGYVKLAEAYVKQEEEFWYA